MEVVKRSTTEGDFYGITEVTVSETGDQLYPYDNKAEAQATLTLVRQQRNPKDPRFKDPAYIATLKRLNRI